MKKIYNTLILVVCITLLLIPFAQAGLIDWFLGLFGLGDNGYPLNYAEGNGFISYTDRVYYNSFKDGYGNTIAGEYYLYNVTSDKNKDDCIYFVSEQDDINSDIPKIYMRDIYSVNRSLWIDTTQASTKEIKDNKFNKKSQTHNIEAYETLEFKIEYKPSKENSKINILLYNCKDDLLNTIDPTYNTTNGIYNANLGSGLTIHKGNIYATTGTDLSILNFTSNGVLSNTLTITAGTGTSAHGIISDGKNFFISTKVGINYYLVNTTISGAVQSERDRTSDGAYLHLFINGTGKRDLIGAGYDGSFYGINRSSLETLWNRGAFTTCKTGVQGWDGITGNKNNNGTLNTNGFLLTNSVIDEICNVSGDFNTNNSMDINSLASYGIGDPRDIKNYSNGIMIIDDTDNFIYVLTGNQPPSVNNITINPNPSYLNQSLNCTIGVSDIDTPVTALSYNISWLKNNVLQFSYNKSLNSAFASSILSIGNLSRYESLNNWTCSVVVNDGVNLGNINSTTSNITSLIINNQQNNYLNVSYGFNSTFDINISLLSGSLTNVWLIYNNTPHLANILTTATNYILSTSIISNTIGSIPFYWFINSTYEDYNTTSSNQIVNQLIFSTCNSTMSSNYINFTFKDEFTGANINSTLNTLVAYQVQNSGVEYSQYSYTNTTEYPSFNFCVSPNFENIKTNFSLTYYASNYPQRKTFLIDKSLTNTTTNQILYLLSSTDGIYTTFQVINAANEILKNTHIIVNSTTGIIADGYTDDSGAATFWLNPNVAYTFKFSKTGYNDLISVITPTQSSYTITLTSTTELAYSGTSYTKGIDLNLYPTDAVLNNNTNYTFGISLTSSYYALTRYGFRLLNQTNELTSNFSTDSSGSLTSMSWNTNNYSYLTLEYYYLVNGTYVNGSKVWFVKSTYKGQFSILNFFDDLKVFKNVGKYAGISDFTFSIIAFVIIFIIISSITYISGNYSPTAILLELFALVGFFNIVGFIPDPPNIPVPYLPTILVGLIFLGYMIYDHYK